MKKIHTIRQERMYKVFIINLDSQPRRLAFMKKQFSILGMEVEKIPAVNGYDKNSIKYAPVASYSFLPGGEVGCFESHRRAWKKIVDENLPGAFILEDDVVVSSDFNELKIEKLPLDELDVIKLDTCSWVSSYGDVIARAGENRELRRLLGSETSAGCYFVTRSGATKLLNGTLNYFEPVDTMMFNMNSKLFYKIRTLKMLPSAAAQLRFIKKVEDLGLEIKHSMQEKRRLGLDPRHQRSFFSHLKLYGRRLKDWDFSAVRRKRQADYLEKHPPLLKSTVVEFYTKSYDHIDQSILLLD